MAIFVPFHQTGVDIFNGVHNFSTDVFKLYLTNQVPDPVNHALLADLPEILAGNGYEEGGVTIAITNVGQIEGEVFIAANDPAVITALVAPIADFRYVILCNTTKTGTPLVAYYDDGRIISLRPNENFRIEVESVLLSARFVVVAP